jgi:hypothetical protein
MPVFINLTLIIISQIRTFPDQVPATGSATVATSFSAPLNICSGFLLREVYADLPSEGTPYYDPFSFIPESQSSPQESKKVQNFKTEIFPKWFFNHDIPFESE